MISALKCDNGKDTIYLSHYSFFSNHTGYTVSSIILHEETTHEHVRIRLMMCSGSSGASVILHHANRLITHPYFCTDPTPQDAG